MIVGVVSLVTFVGVPAAAATSRGLHDGVIALKLDDIIVVVMMGMVVAGEDEEVGLLYLPLPQ